MEQHLSYVAQGENMVFKLKKMINDLNQSLRVRFDKLKPYHHWTVGFQKCYSNHSIFSRRLVLILWFLLFRLITFYWLWVMMILRKLKSILRVSLWPNVGRPTYFFEIEIAHNKHEVVLSQRKYVLNLLQEAGLLAASQCVLLWILMMLICAMRLDSHLREFLSTRDS